MQTTIKTVILAEVGDTIVFDDGLAKVRVGLPKPVARNHRKGDDSDKTDKKNDNEKRVRAKFAVTASNMFIKRI